MLPIPSSSRLFKGLLTFTALSLYLLLSLGSESITSKAKPHVSGLSCDADVGVINGQMDAGINVQFYMENVGEDGVINVMPHLTSSEGEWSRDQTLNFTAGESKHLSYFFPEPTINATNIECYVRTIPSP